MLFVLRQHPELDWCQKYLTQTVAGQKYLIQIAPDVFGGHDLAQREEWHPLDLDLDLEQPELLDVALVLLVI
jgi:hypothetical protein